MELPGVPSPRDSLKITAAYLQRAERVLDELVAAASQLTDRGAALDEHQVITRRVANLATRVEAAHALHRYAQAAGDFSPDDFAWTTACSRLFSAEVFRDLAVTRWEAADDFGLDAGSSPEDADVPLRTALRHHLYGDLAMRLTNTRAENNRFIWSGNEGAAQELELRASTRRFAREVVAPQAERIHREDLLIPESLVRHMAELGYFGMSIPEEYGGIGMSNLMMVIATEELSAASLSAAGSLITRPEILAKALLKGGADEQKRKWLPRIASGELMVAISVTEPNVGSDVAAVVCHATETTIDARSGYLINGAKAWCTFAGRADIIGLLARTSSDPNSGHKGLSLFIVEKDPFPGHEFTMVQPSGGTITGKADATIGYRGMHSFTLQFEDYFVPSENLVGGAGGMNKGFYLQMEGFALGRLQTAGRATGLAQASLAAAVNYTMQRPQFGQSIFNYQSTQYELGRMAVQIEAARQITYASARAMDAGQTNAALYAAMAKLLACRVAVEVSQRAQLLHGGWGYAEEYPISRYVVDALVLPIFEGVEPILEMKVIGRGLLSGTG